MATGSGNTSTSGIFQKDSSQPPCDTYMPHMLTSFYTFDLKSHGKNEFYKKTSSINENRLNALGLHIFANFSYYMTLGEIEL
jgi:hypothetical protein